MRLSKDEIKKQNDKAHKEFLVKDLATIEEEVRIAGLERVKLLDYVSVLRKQKKDFMADYEVLYQKNSGILQTIALHEKRAKEKKEKATKDLKALTAEIKEKTRLLGRLNGDVLSAKDELDSLREDIDVLNKKLEDKRPLLVEIERLRKELDEERRKSSLFLAEANQAKVVLNRECDELEKAIEVKTGLLRDIKYDIEQTKYQLHDLMAEKQKKARDIDIVVKRLEKKYKKAYPELRLNI